MQQSKWYQLEWRRVAWLGLLVVASVAFTLGFACAVPFAAFGAATAITLRARDAMLVMVAVWLANQIVGFGFMGYPWTADTAVWGVVLGIVAVVTMLAAQIAARRLAAFGTMAVAVAAFAGAFAVYEGGLYLISATLLGGTEYYATPIVIQIFEINALAYVGLLVMNRLAIAGGFIAKDEPTRTVAVAR